MATSSGRSLFPTRDSRRRWLFFLIAPAALAGLVFGVSWWLTEPLNDRGASVSTGARTPSPILSAPEPDRRPDVPPDWPQARLEGAAAKKLLLDTLIAVHERLDRVEGYTATFKKQERIKGTLRPQQTLEMKVRHQPFSIYFKYVSPTPGKEVVYAQGHHENKVIAHTPGVAGWLVPRLAVAPDHPLALAESRHAITEAGLANLTNRLLGFREKDMDDPEAVTILDRTTDEEGRPWLRSVHTHPHPNAERPFVHVEVRYDPETRLPVDIRNYDWPEPGHTGALPLAEHYQYEDVDLAATLTALDFDPANPAYAFHR